MDSPLGSESALLYSHIPIWPNLNFFMCGLLPVISWNKVVVGRVLLFGVEFTAVTATDSSSPVRLDGNL